MHGRAPGGCAEAGDPARSSTRKGHTMASFDYDVIVIGSGFGGSAAALGRA